MVKMLNNPRMKANISVFDLVFKLKPTIIGNVGIIHGDNIEITPVKNEIIGIISIKSPIKLNYSICLSSSKNSSESKYPSI